MPVVLLIVDLTVNPDLPAEEVDPFDGQAEALVLAEDIPAAKTIGPGRDGLGQGGDLADRQRDHLGDGLDG
jgi:hypothetical protein